jgi:hypothetical protein
MIHDRYIRICDLQTAVIAGGISLLMALKQYFLIDEVTARKRSDA